MNPTSPDPLGAKTSIQVGTRMFDYLHPEEFKPDLRVLVKALSHIARFGGHTEKFYSVAQHCVLTSVLCPSRPWDALMHDLPEALYGDFTSPMKNLLRETAPKFMERLAAIDLMLEDSFLYCASQDAVHRADLVALAMEHRDLQPNSWACEPYWKNLPADIPAYVVKPASPEEAEKIWWARFKYLQAMGKAPKGGLIPEGVI